MKGQPVCRQLKVDAIFFAVAVLAVAYDGMAQRGQVPSYLVLASCLDRDVD